MSISKLQINHLDKPFGISPFDNSFSFVSDEDGPFIVSLEQNNKTIDKKTIDLKDSVSIYFETPLKYGEKYTYRVSSSLSSKSLDFETTIKLEAPFIKPIDKNIFSPIFKKSFSLKREVKEARLYISGLGLYHAYINKQKVGNLYLTPGFNDYDYYLRYQTYDITDLLMKNNHIEVEMGDGWYKGRFGFLWEGTTGDKIFGDEYKLSAHIRIIYDNDEVENILTDDTWTISSSYETKNNIYDGEEINYTISIIDNLKTTISEEKYNLVPDYGCGVIIQDVLHPTLIVSPKGEYILDFHQNMVGFVKFTGVLRENQHLLLKHGEVLQQGCFYNENLRSAKAEMSYIGDGKKRVFEPKFTFFGFRYVLVEGLEEVNPNDFEGVVLYSDLKTVFRCTTDNPKINQLISNAYWGQRGNFVDLPTDCPQRDERLGWTADTQVFVNTACYQMDCYNFYKKYMKDLRGDQVLYYLGDIAKFSPCLKGKETPGGPVWSDAGTIIPWNFYMNYGDRIYLAHSYQMMRDYVEILIQRDIDQGNKHLILEGFAYGDWLAQDGETSQSLSGSTDHGFIKSMYYYHSLDLTSKAAQELNKLDDYQRYETIKEEVKNAIINKWFSHDGKFLLDTQTSYVLALSFDVYKNKELLIKSFKERLEKDSHFIKTGFVGTPLILNCLFDNNLNEEAYHILYNEEFPGWLYTVNLGATTIWERWNSLLEDGTISGTSMNSLNHYAYGTVCEAIYSRIAGLKNLAPGWKKIEINPHLNYRMKKIDFSFNSPSGLFSISWEIKEQFELKVIIPNGVNATIKLPDGNVYNVTGGEYKYKSTI